MEQPINDIGLSQAVRRAAMYLIDVISGMSEPVLEQSLHLPIVQKKVEIGPRSGRKYRNSRGNIIWLKKEQKEQCRRGELPGAGITCPFSPSSKTSFKSSSVIRPIKQTKSKQYNQ